MSYVKRDWDTTGNEVTKEDFKRIENGIETSDLEIANQKNPTIPGTLAHKINVLEGSKLSNKSINLSKLESTSDQAIYTCPVNLELRGYCYIQWR